MRLLEQCRQAADRLGKQTTYEDIVAAIRGYKGTDRIGFALGLTSYLNDRRVRMPMLDEYRYAKFNIRIVRAWKARR